MRFSIKLYSRYNYINFLYYSRKVKLQYVNFSKIVEHCRVAFLIPGLGLIIFKFERSNFTKIAICGQLFLETKPD